MEQQNILFHSLTEEWKSTELGPEFFDGSRPIPPEEPPPLEPEDGDRIQAIPPQQTLQSMPSQYSPQDMPVQYRPQDMLPLERPQDIMPQEGLQDMPFKQRPHSMPIQQRPQGMPSQQRPMSFPLQHMPQEVIPQKKVHDRPSEQQRLQDILSQQRSQDMPSQQRPQSMPLQQKPQSMPLQQRPQSLPSQQKLLDMIPQQQKQDIKYNATESTTFIGWPSDSFYAAKSTDVPRISGFKSPDYKTKTFMDEIITVPKKEKTSLQGLVVHLRNQLAQKDREIDTLRRNADMQKPEFSCLKEKYSNLQQSFTTVKNQLDTARTMCLSLEKNVSEQSKEQELLKEQCEEQNQTIKNLQTKLQKRTSDVASLENALNIEQSRKISSPEETATIAKYNAREEMAKRFKEDMEKQEELLELERNKNLETINRMQLTKSMFEEQKKSLEEENNQLRHLCEQMDVNAQEMVNTIKSQQQHLTKKNDDLIGMEKEMREIRMRNEEITSNYQKMVASLQTELMQKNSQHDEVEAKVREMDSDFTDLQEELSTALTKIQKLTDENTKLEDRLKKANNEIQRENFEKQTNQEKLIDARQVMTSLKDKVDDLNSSHSKEISLLKQTVNDLENIITRKDDIITEQQSEMSKIKYYIRALEGEMANITEQARLEREKHKTLYEKAGLLSEFLDKSSETLTEKQEEVWALKHQLETNRRLSPIMEESHISQSLFQDNDKSKRDISPERIAEESSSYSVEDLKEDLKYKEQCMQELTNTVIQMGLEAKQKEAELQQEILKLKSIISMKQSILSFREKQLAKAEYELSINQAILREANITVQQKEIELEKERQKSKEATASMKNEESVKKKDGVQEPLLWLSSIEKSENTHEVDSIESHGSCLIYETEIGSLKGITKKGKGSRRENYPLTSTPSKIHAEIAKQTDFASKIIKDLEERNENPPQPSAPLNIDSDKPAQDDHHRSLEIKNTSVKIKTKNVTT